MALLLVWRDGRKTFERSEESVIAMVSNKFIAAKAGKKIGESAAGAQT